MTPIQPIIVTQCWGTLFCSVVDIFPTQNEQEGYWESFKPWLVLCWITHTSSCPDRTRQPKESAPPAKALNPGRGLTTGQMMFMETWISNMHRANHGAERAARCSWQMVAVLMSVWTKWFCSLFVGKHLEFSISSDPAKLQHLLAVRLTDPRAGR